MPTQTKARNKASEVEEGNETGTLGRKPFLKTFRKRSSAYMYVPKF
jgi:hypothetical protein